MVTNPCNCAILASNFIVLNSKFHWEFNNYKLTEAFFSALEPLKVFMLTHIGQNINQSRYIGMYDDRPIKTKADTMGFGNVMSIFEFFDITLIHLLISSS